MNLNKSPDIAFFITCSPSIKKDSSGNSNGKFRFVKRY